MAQRPDSSVATNSDHPDATAFAEWPRCTARWLPYRLPLRQTWSSAAGALTERHGRLLRLETEDGYIGWGDCAPFPAIGITARQAEFHARECARLDILAQRAGQPLAVWLAGMDGAATTGGENVPAASGGAPAPQAGAASSLAVNAALGKLLTLPPAALAAAAAQGFAIVKIKVGNAAPAAELAHLRTLAAAMPAGLRLRLDANRAWSPDEARLFLAACAELPVEAVEEPLRQPDAGLLRRLQADLPFALAVDESLARLGPAVFDNPPARRLILKPARHGGLLATLALARRARQAGLDCIVTSALESACGLLAAAHLAAAIAPLAVHGLATAAWFASDTGEAPRLACGRLLLPTAAGLGFIPGIS